VTTVGEQIQSADEVICHNIESLADQRALLSQNILAQLRNLVEGVVVLLHAGRLDTEFHYAAVAPNACSPTWATTPFPPDSTLTRRVLVPFTSEVPFCSGCCCVEHRQFSLPGGPFRGRGLISSMGGVKSWG